MKLCGRREWRPWLRVKSEGKDRGQTTRLAHALCRHKEMLIIPNRLTVRQIEKQCIFSRTQTRSSNLIFQIRTSNTESHSRLHKASMTANYTYIFLERRPAVLQGYPTAQRVENSYPIPNQAPFRRGLSAKTLPRGGNLSLSIRSWSSFQVPSGG